MATFQTNTDAVRIRDARVRIGTKDILGPLTLTVGDGESWVILGPNGSGKTTLLDLAGGLQHPTSGEVSVLGSRLGTIDVRELRARIGFVGHHVTEGIPSHFEAHDIVLTGKRSTLVPWMQTYDDDDRRRASILLEQVGCTALAHQPLFACSQGERQRVLLARALFGRPELLLLDEPMAGLDLPGRELLLTALTSTAEDAPTTVLVTHHVEEIPRAATHAALLRRGRLVTAGAIDVVLTDANVSSCFDMAVSLDTHHGRWQARAT